MSSGSLKETAAKYDVTYPTVRLRLDKLIQKIVMEKKSYVSLIKRYAIDVKIDFEVAKLLINEYRKNIENGEF